MKKQLIILLLAGLLAPGFVLAQSADIKIPKPKSVTIDGSLSKKQADIMMHAGLMFYAFWNSGNEKYLREAVSADFFDNTLPKGRPQGYKGILFASANFRKAVPDLKC